jgi:FkbM family methyltransferase
MAQFREFISEVYIRQAPLLARLRRTPLLGRLIHYFSHKVLPSDFQVWREIEVGLAKGLWMKINPRTGRQTCKETAEPEIQKILAERLRPGMVFYDVGANIGFFTLAAARLVGETGKVFSFEPDAEVAYRLRENASYNGFAWVSITETALWSRCGDIAFARADVSVSPTVGSVGSSNSRKLKTLPPFARLRSTIFVETTQRPIS